MTIVIVKGSGKAIRMAGDSRVTDYKGRSHVYPPQEPQ